MAKQSEDSGPHLRCNTTTRFFKVLLDGRDSRSHEANIHLAILKAIAENLIPGIPIQTRISILQQISETPSSSVASVLSPSAGGLSILETVLNGAISRNEIQNEIDGL